MTSLERIKRIGLLKKQADLLRNKVKTGKPDLMQKYYDLLKGIERLDRIENGFQDIMYFAKAYFTGSPPHDLLKPDTPSPQFHYELANYLREAVLDPLTRKTCIAAPRSHAKSTIVTNIFPIWCVCYVDDVKERYWVIIGDKQDNARKFLDTIKSEFEDNEMLRADFGNMKGSTWNALEIVTNNQVKLSAHGAGEGLRGLRYGSFRPSVIMDDIESEDSCSTPERIAKMMDWFLRTVLPLGDPKKSKFFLVGTVIHYDSILNQVMNEHADWKPFKFRAIEKYPDRMDLWNKFEEMFYNRDEGDSPMEASRIARTKALEFYEQNKEEMHEGSIVLWKERLDLLDLMEKRAINRLAFNSEYMNEPIDADSRIFSKIWYYDPEDFNLKDCDIFGACDPSMGKSKRSDPSVIITVARHRKTGIIYVLDVDNKRRHPNVIIQDIFKKASIYEYQSFSIETVAFQEFMKDELTKRSAEQRVYLPIKEFKSTTKKDVRISAIEPLLSSGQVRLLPTQKDLIEQLEYFPKARHDDCPDVLAQVLDLCKRKGARLVFSKI